MTTSPSLLKSRHPVLLYTYTESSTVPNKKRELIRQWMLQRYSCMDEHYLIIYLGKVLLAKPLTSHSHKHPPPDLQAYFVCSPLYIFF